MGKRYSFGDLHLPSTPSSPENASLCSLMFITMCHGTWNLLSEVPMLRRLLYSWRADNIWLHTIGGWTLAAWTVLHVWSLFLPSMFHGFRNVAVGGPFDVPLQV